MTLTEEQDRRVEGMAESIYRPCCNNSTLFQDCNHGSAMLGLLELGASQGLGEQELYAVALTANAYWFPTNYSKVALYYEAVEKRPIAEVPPQEVLSQRMSSSSGYRENVVGRLEEAKLMPQTGGRGSGGCSV